MISFLSTNVNILQQTTGTPKGFLHEHVSLCSGVLANSRMLGMNNNSRVFQFASYTFDASFTEMYNTWIHGGCCCIPSDEDRMNLVAETMNRMEINWTFFTPSLARFVRQASIPTLKIVALGGEAVTADDVKDWESKGVKVVNCYSPSESSSWYVSPLSVHSPNGVTLGRTENTLGWIVDPNNDQKLMPIGAVGELLLEGPCLARGYLKNIDKTTKSFVQAPTWRSRYGRLQFPKFYKTGDLVRLCNDGTVAYIGRKDTQVKLRGQRIELDEVKYHVRRNLPSLTRSVTEIANPPGKSPTLAVFIEFGDEIDQIVDMVKVREHLTTQLSKSLPHYMIPQEFLLISDMPLLPSGKVNRQKLKAVGASLLTEQLQPNRHGQPSETLWSTEATALRELWGQVLHIDPQHLKLEDDFFSLGGTSMDVMKLVAAARTNSIKLTYIDVFHSPTIQALTSKISPLFVNGVDQIPAPFTLIKSEEKEKVLVDATVQCRVPGTAIEDIYPCTPQQEGIWALSLIKQGAYMGQFVIKLAKEVDKERFCHAFESIVASNPILRTRIVRSGLGSYQVVLEEQIEWVKAPSLVDYLKEDESIPLNLGEPLSRYAIISETNPPTLVWTVHHALVDGRSHQLILEAIAQEYQSPSQENWSGVPFNKFIKFVQNSDGQESREFWRKEFEGLQTVNFPPLPSLNYRPAASSSLSTLLGIIRKTGLRVTTSTILRAAWALALGQHTKTQDVVFGVTLAGTSSSMLSIESVIGPTFVTLPVRVVLEPGKSSSHFLDAIQAQTIEMIPFEHTGLQNIMAINQECQLACKFQSLFVVQQAPDMNNVEGLFEWHETSQDLKRFNSHGIVWECTMNGESVDLVVSFDENLIGGEDIQKLAADFKNFVHLFSSAEGDRPLSSIADISASSPDNTPSTQVQTSHPQAETKVDASLLEKLKQVWGETLFTQPDKVTANDDFFSSGGNSISAMTLVANARAVGVILSVTDVFRNPQFGLLAATARTSIEDSGTLEPFSLLGSIEKQNEVRENAASQCGIEVSDIENIYPCTSLQAGLMVLSQGRVGSYVAQYTLDFNETLSEHEILALLDKVVAHLPILRTRIVRGDESDSLQVVVSQRPQPQVATNLEIYLQEDRQTLMDYGESLCRFAMVKDSAGYQSHRVVWTAHHALYDESVIRMVADTIEAFYKKIAPALVVSFDFFVKYAVNTDEAAAREYWTTYLQNR
jgi:aryl carrier-like protein